MKTSIIILGVFAALLGGSAPAFAQSAECLQGEALLDEMLLSIPNTCEKDEDCGGFYARLDTCAPPVMIPNKAMFSLEFATEYAKAQGIAKAACKEDFAAKPVCQPKPYKPACHENVCVNAWANKQ